jgi:sulfur carrier protein
VRIVVNDEAHEVAEGTTVAALVGALAPGAAGTAVAVNRAVVPRSTWDVTRLAPGDEVELLVASQGG